MSTAKVKGLAFRTAVQVFGQLKGADRLEQVFALLPVTLRDDLKFGRLVAGGWYPIADYRSLLGAMAQVDGPGVIKEVGAAAIHVDLKLVHKVVLRMLNPSTMMSLAPSLFTKYYNTGSLKTEKPSRNNARARYEGCEGFDRNMWQETLGSTHEVLTLTGVKHIRVRITSGGGDGDSHCVTDVYWSDGAPLGA